MLVISGTIKNLASASRAMLLMIMVCIWCNPSISQISNTFDTAEYNLLIKTGRDWENRNVDSALECYQNAEALATEHNWYVGIAKAKVNMGFAYHYGFQSKKSADFLEAGLEVYEKSSDSSGLLNTHYNLGFLYGEYEDYSHSIQHLVQAANIAQILQDTIMEGRIYNNLGLMYYYAGIYNKANEYQFLALKIKEQMDDPTIALTHLNIGLNHYQQKNYSKSLLHYNLALNDFILNDQRSNLALTYKNIGDVYLEQEEFDSTIAYYNKALKIYKDLQDFESISRYYLGMGNISNKKRQSTEAMIYYQKAMEVLPENGSRRLLFYIYSSMAKLELALFEDQKHSGSQSIDRIIEYGIKMRELADETGSFSSLTESLYVLYSAFKLQANKEKTLLYLELYVTARDSLYSEQKQKAIVDIQTKYETEKKELEIDHLNHQNQLIEEQLIHIQILHKVQHNYLLLATAGIIIVTVLLVITIRSYSKARVANASLKATNLVISKQKSEKETLLRELNHRVKNNLQIIASLFDLQLNITEHSEVKGALRDGLVRINSVSLIHQLLQNNNNVLNIGFKEFIKELSEHIINTFQKKPKADVIINIPDDLEFSVDRTITLGLIITELVTNAMKYAPEDSTNLIIQIYSTPYVEGSCEIVVQDNGRGLNTSIDIATAKSLGLRLVRTLTEQLGGKLVYRYEKGAKFTLQLNY